MVNGITRSNPENSKSKRSEVVQVILRMILRSVATDDQQRRVGGPVEASGQERSAERRPLALRLVAFPQTPNHKIGLGVRRRIDFGKAEGLRAEC